MKKKHKPYRFRGDKVSTNVQMILNYMEVRMNRVAESSIFKPLVHGDMQKLERGLKRIIKNFKKKSLNKKDVTAFDMELSAAINSVMRDGIYKKIHDWGIGED